MKGRSIATILKSVAVCAALATGWVLGDTLVGAECETNCSEAYFFTTGTSSSDPNRQDFHFFERTFWGTQLGCRNIWVTKWPEDTLTNNDPVTRKYKEIFNDVFGCWKNAGVDGEVSVDPADSITYIGQEEEMTCYTACTSDP